MVCLANSKGAPLEFHDLGMECGGQPSLQCAKQKMLFRMHKGLDLHNAKVIADAEPSVAAG